MHSKMNKKRGFTIIELVIVIAVIGILAAILIPTFSNLLSKANYAKDVATVTNINKVYTADKTNKSITRYNTMYQALNVIKNNGYQLKDIQDNSAGGYFIAWDRINDRFVLVDESTDTYMDGNKEVHIDNEYDFFRVYDEMPEEQDYSIYLSNKNVIGNINNLEVGFDAGDNNTVSKLIYNREGVNKTPRDVYIRTNSATDVELRPYVDSDGNGDNVDRYGDCNELINKGPNHSYHELGSVNHLYLNKGHFVLSSGTIISRIFANASDGDISIELKKGSTVGTIQNYNSTYGVTISVESGAQVINFEAHNFGGALNATFYNKPLYSNTLDCNETDYVIFGVGNKGVNECEMPSAETACPDDSHDYVAASGHSLRVCRKCGSYEHVEVSSDGVNETSSTYYFEHDGNNFVQINNSESHTHHYGAPTWHWVNETEAIARFECSSDDCHNSISITAQGDDIERKQLVREDCETQGQYQYIATVNCQGNVYKDEYSEIEYVDATGHNYQFDHFEWDDSGSAQAVLICTHDGNHIVKYNADMSSTVKTAATCEGVGTTTYTASYDGHNENKDYDDIAAISHDYQFDHFEWSEDYQSAKAIYICQNDMSHSEEHAAKVISQTKIEPTYEEMGTTTYTASYGGYQESKDVVDIPILERLLDTNFINHDKFLYRIGNSNSVDISTILDGNYDINQISVVNISGDATGNIDAKDNSKLKFEGTGVVNLIHGDYVLPLQVIDAKNVTSATSASSEDIVLMNDVSFSTISISNGHTLYGNGFKMTCDQDYSTSSFMSDNGYVNLSNGNLDNVQIECPVFKKAVVFSTDANKDSNNRFLETRNAISVNGTCSIKNSYVAGGRCAIYVKGSELMIDNSTIHGGAYCNINVDGSADMTLSNLITEQYEEKCTSDSNSKRLGLGIVVNNDEAILNFEGTYHSYNWINKTQSDNYMGTYSSYLSSYFNNNQIKHIYNDVSYINPSIIFSCDWDRENKNDNWTDQINNSDQTNSIIFSGKDISMTFLGTTYFGGICYINQQFILDDSTIKGSNYVPNKYSAISPTFAYSNDINNSISSYENGVIQATISDSITLDFSGASILKNGQSCEYHLEVDSDNAVINQQNKTITFNNQQLQYTIKFVASIEDNYDKDGNLISGVLSTFSWSLRVELEINTDNPGPVFNNSMSTTGSGHLWLVDKDGTSDPDYAEAIPIYNNVKVNYYDQNGQYHEVDLSNETAQPTRNGTSWSTTFSNGLTLKMTMAMNRAITDHSLVVCGGKLYVYRSDKCRNSRDSITCSITYECIDPNGKKTDLNKTISFTFSTSSPDTYVKISNFKNGTYTTCSGEASDSSCIAKGTSITLADGTQKLIENVTPSDKVLAWDFVSGTYVSSDVFCITNHGEQIYRVTDLKFSDNSNIEIIAEHAMFDATLNQFVVIREDNVDEYIGHSFVKYGNESTTTVTLISAVTSLKETVAYSIISSKQLDVIANDFWTLDPNTCFLFPFTIDENYKYDAEEMEKDINTYGLMTYEEFKQYAPFMSETQFDSGNGKYIKVALGKGIVTMEEIMNLAQLILVDQQFIV